MVGGAGGRRGARSFGVKVKWWARWWTAWRQVSWGHGQMVGALVDGVAPGQLGSRSNGGRAGGRRGARSVGVRVKWWGALVDGVAPGQLGSRSNSGSSLWPSQITKLWKAEVVGLALTMLQLQLCQYLRTVGCIKMDRRGTLSCIYFDREVVHPFIYFMFWLLAELFAYDSHY